jgi:hypothetical protein
MSTVGVPALLPPNDALRPELSTAVVDAVVALRVYIAEHGSDFGYISTYNVPNYKVNEAGWPAVVSPSYSGDGSTSYRSWLSMVGLSRNTSVHITPQEVSELQRVIDVVQADVPLALRLAWYAEHAKSDEGRQAAFAMAALELVTDILGRAEALDEYDRVTLQELYLQREKALLADELRGDLLFPIALTQFELDEPLTVCPGISIEPLDEPTQRARATNIHGADEVNPYLVAAATHAIVLQDVAVSNADGPTPRQVRLIANPPSLAQADMVCQALAIVADREVGYAQVVLRPIGWADRWKGDLPPNENLGTMRRFPSDMTDRGWWGKGIQIGAESLQKLPTVFRRLEQTSARGKLAARRLAQSALRDADDDVLLDACIGLEALLGDGRDELAHRMGLRAATALADDGADPKRVYSMLKQVYDHRSKIVHGNEPKRAHIKVGDRDLPPAAAAVFLLRRLLRSHLAADPPWTPADLDDRLLTSLESVRGPD